MLSLREPGLELAGTGRSGDEERVIVVGGKERLAVRWRQEVEIGTGKGRGDGGKL